MCTQKGVPNLSFTTRRTTSDLTQWKKKARGAAYNQNPPTFLLNVCISTHNADIERVQAQETGTIKSQTMKRTVISRSHTQKPIQFREHGEKGEFFTYASKDEHGQHYHSCATEWGWREYECRPPYKLSKAILQGHSKKQLNYQPTFHTKIQPLPPPKGEEVNNIARSRFQDRKSVV